MASPSSQPQGHRVVALRELEGLTQSDLAVALEVSQGFISHVEKGTKPLPQEVADRAALAYQLPPEFFLVPPDPCEAGVSTFRKNSKATVRDEKRVRTLHTEAGRLFRIASERSGYRIADFDTVATADIEETAENIRSMLGLGPHDPIPNVTRSLERLGVGVIAGLDHAHTLSDHAGITRPSRAVHRPLVATIGELPPAVARFTLLHELAHWLYDRDRVTPIGGVRSSEEKRAHQFAGAMLLPAAAIRERITESLSLHGYLRVKADFGTSVGAILARALTLRAISEQRYRSLQIQLSSQGWRRSEPVTVAPEQPRLLAQAVARGIASDPDAVARTVGVKSELVQHWTGLEPAQEQVNNVIPLRR